MATAASAQEAVGDVEVVITVLPAGKDVLSAYRGEHGGDGLLLRGDHGVGGDFDLHEAVADLDDAT